MSASRIARRYAKALFNVALTSQSVPDVAADLRVIEETADHSPALLSLMRAPLVPKESKRSTLHGVFDTHLRTGLTREFLDLIVEADREEILPEIATAFQEMADAHEGIVPVEVRSAVPLTDDQLSRLKRRLDDLTGKETRLEPMLDPVLIGGMRVRIGDTIYDGSVRGHLDRFGDRIRAIPVTRLMSGWRGEAARPAGETP